MKRENAEFWRGCAAQRRPPGQPAGLGLSRNARAFQTFISYAIIADIYSRDPRQKIHNILRDHYVLRSCPPLTMTRSIGTTNPICPLTFTLSPLQTVPSHAHATATSVRPLPPSCPLKSTLLPLLLALFSPNPHTS